MKQHLIFALILFGSSIGFAQQEPFSLMYWNNYMHINPAFTGLIYKHEANLNYAGNFKQHQKNYYLRANYARKIEKINSGIGVSYENSRSFYDEFNTVLVSYAYHIPIREGALSLGVSAGMFDFNFNDRGLGMDYSMLAISKVKFNPIFQGDAGISYHHEKCNFGFGVTQLSSQRAGNDTINYTQVPHFWLTADYSFRLNDNLKLTPRVQFARGNTFNEAMFYVNLTIKDKFWIGPQMTFNGRINESMYGLSAGYDFWNKFRLGYALNIYKGFYSSVFSYHEFLVSFHIK